MRKPIVRLADTAATQKTGRRMKRTAEQRAVIAQADAIKRAGRKADRKARPPRVTPTAAGQRQPRIHDAGFLSYTRRLPCCVGPVGCSGGIEAAHIRYGRRGAPTGLGIKPNDSDCVPLCRGHHRDGPDAQHAGSERAWWVKRGLDPFAIAAANFADYQRGAA